MYEVHCVIFFLSNVDSQDDGHWKIVLAVRLMAVTCELLELWMQNLVHIWHPTLCMWRIIFLGQQLQTWWQSKGVYIWQI